MGFVGFFCFKVPNPWAKINEVYGALAGGGPVGLAGVPETVCIHSLKKSEQLSIYPPLFFVPCRVPHFNALETS